MWDKDPLQPYEFCRSTQGLSNGIGDIGTLQCETGNTECFIPSHIPDAKEEGIEASYKDGVLHVTIPKSERTKQKKIPVKMN
jgi:hypothetical protein